MSENIAIRSPMSVKIEFDCGCTFETVIQSADFDTTVIDNKCKEHPDAGVLTILKKSVAQPCFPTDTLLQTPQDY